MAVVMTRIKICGLMREQDIDAVNIALPDFIGFVFARSRRQIDEKKARTLKSLLNPSIKAVGVFVNEEIENVIKFCMAQVIDVIQLHGDENEDYIKRLKNSVSNKIIKAVRVKDRDDIKRASEFSCDYLLLDSYHGKEYGGTGRPFDWSMIPDMNKPFFLAGGINVDNAVQAIKLYNPYCIDVSSGVETDGYKDPKKIMDIVAKVRGLKQGLQVKQQYISDGINNN